MPPSGGDKDQVLSLAQNRNKKSKRFHEWAGKTSVPHFQRIVDYSEGRYSKARQCSNKAYLVPIILCGCVRSCIMIPVVVVGRKHAGT